MVVIGVVIGRIVGAMSTAQTTLVVTDIVTSRIIGTVGTVVIVGIVVGRIISAVSTAQATLVITHVVLGGRCGCRARGRRVVGPGGIGDGETAGTKYHGGGQDDEAGTDVLVHDSLLGQLLMS
jgi:hypothetical protein